jgi:vacuolar-type H+-ATPase subunit B/Vma2
MNANNDPLGKALNLSPVDTGDTIKIMEAQAHDDSAKNDFEMARANIYEVIQNGLSAIDRLSQIADQSQHPRAFEVLGGLMKTMLDANKDLLELQKKIREIDASDGTINDETKNVTNNLFVGSTAELQRMIENMRDGSEKK